MGWKRRISFVVLAVLTALPVSGTVCAMLCDSAAATRAAGHHGSGNCDVQSASSSGSQVRGASGDDCGTHDAALPEIAATTASRADGLTASSLLAAVSVYSTIASLVGSDATFDHRAPPRTPPLTASPVVLRV